MMAARPLPPRGMLAALSTALAIASVSALPSSPDGQSPRAPVEQLWVDPGDIAARDAFHGIGGAKHLPDTSLEFEVEGFDTTGYSRGFDVRDAAGRKWDVKVGHEAQVEVVASRVLWLIGYHQPIVYFVPEWRARGAGTEPTTAGRFRLESFHDTEGDWPWKGNPFSGTREFKGLLVANLVLGNWDFKTSNNRIYSVPDEAPGPRRWFVVQDIGASLGRAGWLSGSRNDIQGFESRNLIKEVKDGVVRFDFSARHDDLLADITPADVAWACGLLDRITDQQWADVFRAATYDPEVAARFRTKLKSKVAEGLALRARAREGR